MLRFLNIHEKIRGLLSVHIQPDHVVCSIYFIPMAKTGRIRIIGGQWRSRILRFSDSKDLRPTPDRVRETLFNWLRDKIADSVCLDLFAGSGALGFEAASHQAREVVMIEKATRVVRDLHENANALEADNISIINNDYLRFLENCDQKFDIVFVDPPYRFENIDLISRTIDQSSLLNSDARIYTESSKPLLPSTLPSSWRIIREKRCGQVHATLIET